MSVKDLANLTGYKYLAITAMMNVVVVLAQPARITNQTQFLVIAVVVSITGPAEDQWKMETAQTKPLPHKNQSTIRVWY